MEEVLDLAPLAHGLESLSYKCSITFEHPICRGAFPTQPSLAQAAPLCCSVWGSASTQQGWGDHCLHPPSASTASGAPVARAKKPAGYPGHQVWITCAFLKWFSFSCHFMVLAQVLSFLLLLLLLGSVCIWLLLVAFLLWLLGDDVGGFVLKNSV